MLNCKVVVYMVLKAQLANIKTFLWSHFYLGFHHFLFYFGKYILLDRLVLCFGIP